MRVNWSNGSTDIAGVTMKATGKDRAAGADKTAAGVDETTAGANQTAPGTGKFAAGVNDERGYEKFTG